MATSRPTRSLLMGIASASKSSRYICQPCLRSRQNQQHIQTRSLHSNIQPPPIPKPTPFVPDAATFLKLIGRSLSTHASKFTTWESLFKLTSPQLKELGIEPTRSRRYLLRWREKFRRGEYGIGGDFAHVSPEGVGELRVVEVPALSSSSPSQSTSQTTSASISHTPGTTKLILNLPAGQDTFKLKAGQKTKDLRKPNFLKLKDGHIIVGTHVMPAKGSNGSVATLQATEGLWEDKRGRKIFGGERRRAETLHKMRIEERKKNA